MRRTPGLEALAASVPAIEAVAQHYGIPTHLLDFTTEPRVAGFFASHGRRAGAEGDSVLLCLNPGNLRRFGEVWSEVDRLEFHTLDVPNLWRLEAQHGVFLYCPYVGLENIYDVDKIVFPYTAPVANPTSEQIYPSRKSALEILLDQYFEAEALSTGNRRLADIGFPHLRVGEFDQQAEPWLRLREALHPHPSWERERPLWLAVERERIGDVVDGGEAILTVDSGQAEADIVRATALQVQQLLQEDPDLRRRLVRWVLRDEGLFAGFGWEAAYSPALARLWDGMRRLPYTDAELTSALGSCVALAQTMFDLDGGGFHGNHQRARRVLGRCIEVNLAAPDDSYSRALVAPASLRSAFRADLAAAAAQFGVGLNEEDVYALIGIIPDPRLLFDFRRLASVFVREIAPTQVLMRKEDRAVFYSPARLDVLGQP